VKLQLVQSKHLNQDPEAALKLLESTISEEANVAIFPELFLSGYVLNQGLLRIAKGWQRYNDEISKIASERGVAIVYGTPRIVDGVIRNSAVAVLPDGNWVAYDKMHLVNFGPFREALYMAPGSEPKMFRLGGLRFGLSICYDLFFPELHRFYARAGADVIINISASPSTSKPLFETLISARAIENTLFHVYVNWGGGGYLEGFPWWGGSRVVDPRGRILARARYYAPDELIVDLDPSSIPTARLNRMSLRDSLLTWDLRVGRPRSDTP